jgi:hypothetical protein
MTSLNFAVGTRLYLVDFASAATVVFAGKVKFVVFVHDLGQHVTYPVTSDPAAFEVL